MQRQARRGERKAEDMGKREAIEDIIRMVARSSGTVRDAAHAADFGRAAEWDAYAAAKTRHEDVVADAISQIMGMLVD